ncbi:hypothetical protein EDD18DRAFT_671682 [Armillaria luteobubalina]|uniref:Uncharacterized protein n=1 Tax=Armillaria luteobubalina TaxID=153913 RepID=A0AA39PN20_9AGAR|nr:hypothetical protein EDD18DRAFT_671682 [Armillaria luteobubalina]
MIPHLGSFTHPWAGDTTAPPQLSKDAEQTRTIQCLCPYRANRNSFIGVRFQSWASFDAVSTCTALQRFKVEILMFYTLVQLGTLPSYEELEQSTQFFTPRRICMSYIPNPIPETNMIVYPASDGSKYTNKETVRRTYPSSHFRVSEALVPASQLTIGGRGLLFLTYGPWGHLFLCTRAIRVFHQGYYWHMKFKSSFLADNRLANIFPPTSDPRRCMLRELFLLRRQFSHVVSELSLSTRSTPQKFGYRMKAS